MRHSAYDGLHVHILLDDGAQLEEFRSPDKLSHDDTTVGWYVELQPERCFVVQVSCDLSQLPSSLFLEHDADGIDDGGSPEIKRNLLLLIEIDGCRLYYGRPSREPLEKPWTFLADRIMDQYGNFYKLKFGSIQIKDKEGIDDGDLPKELGQIDISLFDVSLRRLSADTEHDLNAPAFVDRASVSECAIKGKPVKHLVRAGARMEPDPSKKERDVVDIIRRDVIACFKIQYRTREGLEQEGVCTRTDVRDNSHGNGPHNPIIID